MKLKHPPPKLETATPLRVRLNKKTTSKFQRLALPTTSKHEHTNKTQFYRQSP
jgi:hypothetical protein